MSVAKQVQASKTFQSGKPFTPMQVSKEIGVNVRSVRSACVALRERGDAHYEDRYYRKPSGGHWIWKTPISKNPPKLFGDRKWV